MSEQQMGMRRKRPVGVSILAILTILFGILAVIGGVAAMGLAVVGGIFGSTFPAGQAFLFGALTLVFGIVALVAGAGLWGLQKWAWWLVLIVGIVEIALAAFQVPIGYISIALWAIIIIYLIIVRKAFMGPPAQPTMT